VLQAARKAPRAWKLFFTRQAANLLQNSSRSAPGRRAVSTALRGLIKAMSS